MDVNRQNKALLAKWIWRFYLEKEALWRKVIENKCGSCHFERKSNTELKASSKSPWSFIVAYSGLIYRNLVYNIGDKKETLFWYDHWISDSPLNVGCPLLFALTEDKSSTIDEFETRQTVHGFYIYRETSKKTKF